MFSYNVKIITALWPWPKSLYKELKHVDLFLIFEILIRSENIAGLISKKGNLELQSKQVDQNLSLIKVWKIKYGELIFLCCFPYITYIFMKIIEYFFKIYSF